VREESEWPDVITIGIRRFDGVKVIRKMAKVLVSNSAVHCAKDITVSRR